MRSLLLFFLALGVFIAAYAAVAWLMPDPGAAPRRQTQVVPTEPRDADHVIGDIDGVTLRSHDAATGAPIAEIRIGEYRRSGENQVLLRDIQATILTEGGSGVITLTAPTGTVDLEAEAEQQDRLTAETLGTADVARLSDVVVRWYETAADAARGPAAALLTLRVNNLIYDNKQFSLFTDDTVIDGATVLADDVPVEVRGRDYDFDGRGLLVRWDARTRRPTLFRVARGERLTIKTDQSFMPEQIVGGPHRPGGRRGPLLASLDAQATAEALADVAVEPYLATLSGNIRAVQGGLTMLEADAARLLFSLDSLPQKQEPATREATTKPATTRAAPSTAPIEREEPFVPITVYWQGELLIEAASDPSQSPLTDPEDMRLSLLGSPLVMRRDEVEARGLELHYARSADELHLIGDVSTPVTLVDAERNTLVTTRLFARPGAGTATATAAGYADVVTGDEPMQLRWQQDCDFVFEPRPREEDEEKEQGQERPGSQLKSVSARGAVTVRHPDVWLDSETLDVALAPAAEGEDSHLRSVLAGGGVRSVINPQRADERTLTSDKLSLELAEGLEGPVIVVAEGNVRSDQEEQGLRADLLQARLLPDDQGELKLSELAATGNVEGAEVDGPKFRADVMIATPLAAARKREVGEDEPMLVRLEGAQGRNAVVEVGTDVLAAPSLEFNTADETVHVPGAGEVYSVQLDDDGRGWPLVITWTTSMLGGPRQVTIEGDVRLDGRREGDQAGLATFIDFQTAQAVVNLSEPDPAPEAEEEAEAEAEEDGPATLPTEWTGQVEQVSLRGDLSGTVEERQGETLLRSFDLRAQSMDAWPVGDMARVVIDSAGRVLFRDLRPLPQRQPAGAPAADGQEQANRAISTAGFRGSAAVEWSQRLSFEPDTGILLLEGGVGIAVEPAASPPAAGEPVEPKTFRLDADQVRARTAQVEERVGGEVRRQTEIRAVVATGRARFSTDGVSFEAGEIQYDPATARVTARGAAGVPVVVYDADGVPTGRFAELIYNVESGQIEQLRDLSAGG